MRGDDDGLGWWSDRFEARVPSWLLLAGHRGAAPLVSATVLRPLREGVPTPVTDVSISTDSTEISVAWLDEGRSHAVVVDSSRAGAVRDAARPVGEATHGP